MALWDIKGKALGVPCWKLLGGKCREVCTERDLLNVGGIFYEMPADNAGGVAVIKPIASHPAAFSAYWARFVSDRDAVVSAQFGDVPDDGD